jgi:hypothetical protein
VQRSDTEEVRRGGRRGQEGGKKGGREGRRRGNHEVKEGETRGHTLKHPASQEESLGPVQEQEGGEEEGRIVK